MGMQSSKYPSAVEKPGRSLRGQPAPYPVASGSGMSGWRSVVKRSADIMVSLVCLPALAIVGTLIAVVIRLDSPGPVFYRQERVGKGGRRFTMYKFRSMFRDADKMLDDLNRLNEAEGPVFKIRNDPRITRVGRFIRKTSLDELPQVINVIKGEMSLVGPRPPIPREVEKYSAYQMGRLAVIPGMTCLWQIQGRSEVSFDEWVELDLEYIRNQSLLLDLKILLKTIPAVLIGSGAW